MLSQVNQVHVGVAKKQKILDLCWEECGFSDVPSQTGFEPARVKEALNQH